MNIAEINRNVITVLQEQFGLSDSSAITSKTTLRDLHGDSLDSIELLMDFEDEFQISINDEEAERMNTVEDAVDVINKCILRG